MDRFSVIQAIQPKTNDGSSPASLQLGVRQASESQQISEPRGLGIQANAVDRARKPNWLFLGSIASFVGLVLTMIIALADRQTAQDALAR
jgi:hypothetical protein